MKKSMRFFVIGLLALLVLPFFAFSAGGGGIIDWGIGHNDKNRVPNPPDGAITLLEKYNGKFVQDTSEKKFYFTFDLGYEAGYTAEVLDILKQHNITAVFFLCGHYLNETELVNRIITEGHIIGNHTDKHKDLPKLNKEDIKKDITDFQDLAIQKFNITPTLFRPPKGRICEKSMSVVNDCGLKTIMWSNAIIDWGKTPIDANKNCNLILKRLHPGTIMLFHITNSSMPNLIRMVIDGLSSQGYSVGCASEL